MLIDMPLSSPATPRQSLHHRHIAVHGFKREDGLFEVEGELRDTKDVDINLASGTRHAGEAIHTMQLRLTFDTTLTIVDAEAVTDAMPYAGMCDTIGPHYKKLIGLSMRPGFTAKVRELFSGTRGCTHLTDLIGILATTAFQTIAGQIKQSTDSKPYQLDRCHALATDAPAVATYYPRWYRGSKPIDFAVTPKEQV
jgi:Protein of unknown function (DUF2889)